MLWPAGRATPEITLPHGYLLRTFAPADADAYLALMHAAGFTQWDVAHLTAELEFVLPDGLFVVEHMPTAALVATAMAEHHAGPLHPFGGELGWVAGDARHAHRGLGRAVCTAVVRRLLSAGYRRIYLKTDDFRLPAIAVYLRMGFAPFLYQDDMFARWQAVCAQLDWPYTPEAWPGMERRQ
ncbi:MAG: Mycothiol acetyltransferase [Chloroflexi bacterium ADurb.Bin325]|nr:MAG: Mycothiol acetyltransferase [Chloroflexi bacterium ADurb.Bin325]